MKAGAILSRLQLRRNSYSGSLALRGRESIESSVKAVVTLTGEATPVTALDLGKNAPGVINARRVQGEGTREVCVQHEGSRMRSSLAAALLLFAAASTEGRRPVAQYVIDLDLPPEVRWHAVIHGSNAGGISFNKTVWAFYNEYFANDTVVTDALYALTDLRGEENAEQQGEIRGLARASNLPLKFVQGIQMLYELQTLMVPIVNCTDYPVPSPAAIHALRLYLCLCAYAYASAYASASASVLHEMAGSRYRSYARSRNPKRSGGICLRSSRASREFLRSTALAAQA